MSNQNAATATAKNFTKEFHDLVKHVGECKSKSDEDVIVARQAEMLKAKLSDPKMDKTKLKEYLLRAVYVEMLGHDASFSHIHAVKAAHESAYDSPGGLSQKKMGYLATCLFLDDQHELILLIINTLQQDLKSDNFLVVCTALTAICKLVNADTVPAVLPSVVELLGHAKESVRKKAIMALHRCWLKAPTATEPMLPRFRQMLCDKDPSVMAAAVSALYDLISADPLPYKNLVPSFVNILKQIIDHRLPKSYDYHKSPAPFIQIRLLKILGVLGANDQKASEEMYAVLTNLLRRGDNHTTIGNALVYECVKTVTAIYPSPKLLELSAGVVARFLKAKSHNLKYAGLSALAAVVRVSPKYASEHQMAVIDCLEDPDETLKKGTLDLLYRMTKTNNVEVIVERMTEYLRTASNEDSKKETVTRIVELAERYAPSSAWFISTMNAMFEQAGDLVQLSTAHNLARLIAEGNGDDDEEADNALRAQAVESYFALLEKPRLPEVLLHVIVWVLGEYGALVSGRTPSEVMDMLCSVVDCQPEGGNVEGPVLTAITKVAAQTGAPLTAPAASLMKHSMSSSSTDLQQRAYELRAVIAEGRGASAAAALPQDASCEDLEPDADLKFLDGYVAQAVASGAATYREPPPDPLPAQLGVPDTPPMPSSSPGLRFSSYQEQARAPFSPGPGASTSGEGERSGLQSPAPALKLAGSGGQRRWGPMDAAPPQQGTPPAPAPAASGHYSEGARAAPPPAAAQPAAPPVDPSKQRLAASLFGGGGGGGGAAAEPAAAQRAQSRLRPKQPAAPPPQQEANLLDLDDPAPAAPPPSALPDVLGELESLTLAANPEIAQQQAASRPRRVDLDSLYAAAAAPPQQQMAPQAGMYPPGMGQPGMMMPQGMGMMQPGAVVHPGMVPMQQGMMPMQPGMMQVPGMAPQQPAPGGDLISGMTGPPAPPKQDDPFKDLLS